MDPGVDMVQPGSKVISNRLHVLKAERRWSQAELARRMHVSRQTIVALENGRFQPTLQLAFRIVHVFDTNIEDVFTPDAEDLTLVDTQT
jgi:putative transcriptional regulator